MVAFVTVGLGWDMDAGRQRPGADATCLVGKCHGYFYNVETSSRYSQHAHGQVQLPRRERTEVVVCALSIVYDRHLVVTQVFLPSLNVEYILSTLRDRRAVEAGQRLTAYLERLMVAHLQDPLWSEKLLHSTDETTTPRLPENKVRNPTRIFPDAVVIVTGC